MQKAEKYSRQLQSFFELGSRHEEGVEHRHALREHCDLQLVFILRKAGKRDLLNRTIMRNYHCDKKKVLDSLIP